MPPLRAASSGLTGHIPALDGIRGLAILMVTAFRFNIGPACDWLPGRWLFAALKHGDLGVTLFFVLSGFLITGILFDAKGEGHYFRNFYVRRALRIFPLYYGCLFVALVALPFLFGPRGDLFPEARANQVWLWLYGANFLMAFRNDWCLGSFTHFWSLSIEEQFYLFWPLVIFFCSRRQALRVSLIAIVVSMLGRVAWIAAGGPEVAIDVLTFLRLDALALGSLLALAARQPNGIRPLVRWAALAGGICIATILVAACLHHERLFGLSTAMIAGFFGALLMLAVAARPSTWWGAIWRSPVLAFFGKYSYAMYVFQLPLIRLLAPIVTPEGLCYRLGSVFAGRVTYIAVMMTITTGAAIVSWNLYEKHFLALKARFEPRPMADEAHPTAGVVPVSV
ncbi:MAG TPA: acyltransferase [Planctomycetaceae bacterium]|nr:acyltransferase [Planctomycetaceae bacterium]